MRDEPFKPFSVSIRSKLEDVGFKVEDNAWVLSARLLTEQTIKYKNSTINTSFIIVMENYEKIKDATFHIINVYQKEEMDSLKFNELICGLLEKACTKLKGSKLERGKPMRIN